MAVSFLRVEYIITVRITTLESARFNQARQSLIQIRGEMVLVLLSCLVQSWFLKSTRLESILLKIEEMIRYLLYMIQML